jgi:hypothetical protein
MPRKIIDVVDFLRNANRAMAAVEIACRHAHGGNGEWHETIEIKLTTAPPLTTYKAAAPLCTDSKKRTKLNGV